MSDDRTHPEGLELRSTDCSFRISWADGHETVFSNRNLRILCRCASCVDEMTGRPILDPASVPEDQGVDSVAEVGNYGLRINWSGGHGTGIYTWDRLRERCPCCQEGAGA